MPDSEAQFPSPSQASRSEQTRAQILNAAFQVFCEQGYHGASMRQIARGAGIALGGIYNHFASKEEIFLDVLYQRHPIFHMFPEILKAAGENAEAFVCNAAERMVSSFDGRSDFIKLMFIELVEFDGAHFPKLLSLALPQVMQLSQRFEYFSSQLRPIPAPIQMRAFISLFFAYLMFDLLVGKDLAAELQQGALEYFVDIYLHGILPAPGEQNVPPPSIAAGSTE